MSSISTSFTSSDLYIAPIVALVGLILEFFVIRGTKQKWSAFLDNILSTTPFVDSMGMKMIMRQGSIFAGVFSRRTIYCIKVGQYMSFPSIIVTAMTCWQSNGQFSIPAAALLVPVYLVAGGLFVLRMYH
jgi:hypothetical protein